MATSQEDALSVLLTSSSSCSRSNDQRKNFAEEKIEMVVKKVFWVSQLDEASIHRPYSLGRFCGAKCL